MQLDKLPKRRPAHVARVEWALLPADEARRLQALGVEPGVEVEVLHRGILFWKDPLAVRIGRMTVAMRRGHAAAILCETITSGEGVPA